MVQLLLTFSTIDFWSWFWNPTSWFCCFGTLALLIVFLSRFHDVNLRRMISLIVIKTLPWVHSLLFFFCHGVFMDWPSWSGRSGFVCQSECSFCRCYLTLTTHRLLCDLCMTVSISVLRSLKLSKLVDLINMAKDWFAFQKRTCFCVLEVRNIYPVMWTCISSWVIWFSLLQFLFYLDCSFGAWNPIIKRNTILSWIF